MQSALLGEAFVTVLLSTQNGNLIDPVSDDSSPYLEYQVLRNSLIIGRFKRLSPIFINGGQINPRRRYMLLVNRHLIRSQYYFKNFGVTLSVFQLSYFTLFHFLSMIWTLDITVFSPVDSGLIYRPEVHSRFYFLRSFIHNIVRT